MTGTKSPLLAALPPAQVQEVLAAARPRKFARGEVVFHEGDPGDSMHVVSRGHFALRGGLVSGEISTLRVFGPGDLFGRIAMGGLDATRVATIVSLDAGETHEIPRPLMDRLRASSSQVGDALIGLLAYELRLISQRYLELLHLDADRRVRRRLVELAAQYRTGDGEIVVTLAQEDLAGLAGTSRATVNRVLSEDERRGALARRRGRIVIADLDALRIRAR